MHDNTENIQTLTSFRRQSGDFMKQLKKRKRPVILTVKGKAAAVVLGVQAYQRLLDIAASANAEEGIRQGMEDARNGRTRPAKEFFEEFEANHALPRHLPRHKEARSSAHQTRKQIADPTAPPT